LGAGSGIRLLRALQRRRRLRAGEGSWRDAVFWCYLHAVFGVLGGGPLKTAARNARHPFVYLTVTSLREHGLSPRRPSPLSAVKAVCVVLDPLAAETPLDVRAAL
jgi:hypothetical protein